MTALCSFSPGIKAIVLVDSGKSDYTIVLRENASPSERHGARELQMYLEMISGAYLPLRNAGEAVEEPVILVGKSDIYGTLTGGISLEDLGDEGFAMITRGQNLILAGGQKRGSMYAVYTFLEEELGCRWYTSDCSRIPSMKTIEVRPLNETQKPAFEYREPFWKDGFDADWAARNRVNSSWSSLDLQRGGKADWPSGHTFYPLLPPDQHFVDHPEWYSILANRKREWEYGQLCLTNPETQRAMTHSVKRQMAEQPERTIHAVSQNDWHVACDCPHCRSVDTREGSHAGSLVYFVNAVADRTKKDFPDKLIITFAYTYTEKVPKYAIPSKNVIIWLCNMNHLGGCDAHPLEQCDRNSAFVENLKGWSKIAEKIYIWDYVTNFAHYLQPFPIWKTNSLDLAFYNRIGVDGIFDQGCYHTVNGGCSEIMAYIEAKLMWDPSRDVEPIVNDFLEGYYGAASAEMKELYALMQKRVMDDWCHFTLYSPTNIDMFSPEFLAQAIAILDRAEKAAAGYPDILYRIESARLWFNYIRLAQPVPRIIENSVYAVAPEAPAFATLRNLDEFIRTCHKHGVTDLSEGGQYFARQSQMIANLSPHKIVTIENQVLKVDLIPSLGGRIHQITDKRTGKALLRTASATESSFPLAGGMRESPTGANRCTYILEETPDGSKITMEVYLQRGTQRTMLHTREIALSGNKAELQFNSSLKALIDFHDPVRISPSIDLSIGDSEVIRTGMADGSGGFQLSPLTYESDEWNRLAKRYRTRDLESGKLCIMNAQADIAVIAEYNPDAVEVLSISGKENVALGIQGVQRLMKPGDTINLSYKLRFTGAGDAR